MIAFPERARPALAWALTLAACGDNIPAPLDGPPLVHADSLFVIAHFDDDLIFMQPELIESLESGSVMTVYVTSGEPIYGLDRTDRNFGAARTAYASVMGSSDWDCGYVPVGGSPAHHCRLRDRPLSLVALDIPDGGILGQREVSPLNLVENVVSWVPIMGRAHGIATKDTIIDSLAALLEETRPAEIHALDLSAKNGYDHSSHMFSSSFAFWGAARAGYPGPIHWHRGYNVGVEPITLVDADYEVAKTMLGYFEACYFACGPCGSSCEKLPESHETWLRRQYGFTRSPIDARGVLGFDDAPGLCLAAAGNRVVLADCAQATPVQLDASGHLTVAGACVASGAGNADPVVLAPCASTPAQYWVSDSDGHLWNGSPPAPEPDMNYDHVRCLTAEPAPGELVTTSLCGSRKTPRWQFSVN